MAQKSLKSLAARNTTTLNRTHLITLAIHILYHLLRTFLHTRNKPSLLLYTLLSAPALLIEIWFERIGRPTYTTTASGGKDLRRAGEDLEAKGLTEWMWDVVYWTWGCVVCVAVFRDKAWWLWGVVPVYSAWLAFATFSGVRKGFGGMMGQEGEGGGGAQSKRQAKIEKRGGQKVAYR